MDIEERLDRLEAQILKNKKNLSHGKNAKAILVLGIVLFMVLEIDSPLPGGGRFKSSRLNLSQIAEIALLGAWAIGTISLEDILQMKFKTSKPSEPSCKGDEHEG